MASPWYVTHDAGGGGIGTKGDPFTLVEACDTVVAGETVYVKASGDYTIEYATGGAKNSIFYMATGGGATTQIHWIGYHTIITDGGIVTIDALDTLANPLEAVSKDYISMENFVFKQGTSHGGNLSGSDHWYFKNCSFEENGDDGITSPETTIFIGCRFINNVNEGVDSNGSTLTFIACLFSGNGKLGASYTSYCVFIECNFYNNGLIGGQWAHSSGYALGQIHYNCTFDGENGVNLARGIYCNRVAGGLSTIVNTILHDNAIAIDGSVQQEMAIANSLFNSNTTDVNNGRTFSNGNGIGDDGCVADVPGFEDEAADDYSLGSGSAAADVGIDADFTTKFWLSFDGATNPPVV